MKSLFDGTTDELRRLVPGIVANFTLKPALKSQLDQSAESLLPRFVGTTIADQITESSESSDATLKGAFGLAQQAMAKLGFADYLPFAEVQIGDDGITVTAVDGRRAAFDYQTQKLDRSLRETGWQKLDELLQLIAANDAKFPGWNTAPYYLEHQQALFKTAQDFSKSYPIQNRWLTFWALRPFIQAAEDDFGTLNLDRIDALPNAVTDEQKAPLKRKLFRAIAYEAVLSAIPNLSVELSGNNVQVNYASQYGGNATYYTPPGKDLLEWWQQNLRTQADTFWQGFENALAALLPTSPSDDEGGDLLGEESSLVYI
ncbi:hypothetical protein IC229_05830 [Spirosoma sp. BT702]|uniref:Uncharacterized protein n=1 Tax=Spirosoma profusum TaxID=2771354 RepID=A0A926Y1C0_9BACT|nr:DUF6712 family protein [Spirosoma profusum]MBD2700145.1 hypothetical protein [Spirosoma profusum]